MPKFNRRKGDGVLGQSSSIHYRRKPNEAKEIHDFLRLCVTSHSRKHEFEDSKTFKCAMNDFLDYRFINPIPRMIRKVFKLIIFRGGD